MLIADMMRPEGRVFLKSEFGQISDEWPCLSFTKRAVGVRLAREFVPGRDVLVYVGTTDATQTHDPAHRSRLISAVVVEPNQILETRKIVRPDVWSRWEATNRGRWPHSLAVLKAANFSDRAYPDAREVVPTAYRALGAIQNRGNVVEATGPEREAVMALFVTPIELHLSSDVQAYVQIKASVRGEAPKDVRDEAMRMAELIIQRVKSGGEAGVVIRPLRTAPNFSDLYPLLVRKWQHDQKGCCALCEGPLVAGTKNNMLKPSADRVNSTNGAYDAANVQVTHLACNLAKNQYGSLEFAEWLAIVRDVELEKETDV